MTQWGIDTLFNPAKRHMDEEKRRLQSTRQQIGDNSGGKRIDLESGRVKIARSDDDQVDDAAALDEPAGADESAGTDEPTASTAAGSPPAKKPAKAARAGGWQKDSGAPSAAAKRAAARRGRTLD